jgi:hypothetical protein
MPQFQIGLGKSPAPRGSVPKIVWVKMLRKCATCHLVTSINGPGQLTLARPSLSSPSSDFDDPSSGEVVVSRRRCPFRFPLGQASSDIGGAKQEPRFARRRLSWVGAMIQLIGIECELIQSVFPWTRFMGVRMQLAPPPPPPVPADESWDLSVLPHNGRGKFNPLQR